VFTGTPEELKRREAQARTIAGRIALLLDDLEALGLSSASGQLHTPGGVIRQQPGRGWVVTSR
jgi:hypothetical protein